MADAYTLEIHSAVVRFDAADKLFIHLTHSSDDPAAVQAGGATAKAPGGEKRAWLVGGGDGAVTGAFPTVNDLPRGLVLEVHGYDAVTLRDDGVLEVVVSDPSQKPDWLTAGTANVVRRDTEGLRMWSKSFLPGDACSMTDGTGPAKASVRTQGSRPTTLVEEKPAPKAEAPKAAATPEPPKAAATPEAPKAEAPKAEAPKAEAPRAEPAKPAGSEPYRPDRAPAGSYTAHRLGEDQAAKKASGCLGVLAVLAVTSLLPIAGLAALL